MVGWWWFCFGLYLFYWEKYLYKGIEFFFENLKFKVKYVDFILFNNILLLEKNNICNNKRDLLGNWYIV